MKRRIDQLLVERGFAESRHKAQALLMAGQILVDEQKVEKAGQRVDPHAEIRVLRQLPFASRAGSKLQAALDHFRIFVMDRACADLGASTGGFTDCLIQNGACRVYAFDVGKGQLHWKLQSDPRVIIRDEFNVRHLKPGDLPEDISFVSIDLSFISVTKILPSLKSSLVSREPSPPNRSAVPELEVVVLVKPQFEAEKGTVGKRGIVRDPAQRARIVDEVAAFARKTGFQVMGCIPSPVAGTGGNREYLLYLKVNKGLLS
jgi:23S rRNA (cytidine1920-2'-O)/16S rRNA (cytidine1409-2'-O)-methyltransferase